jgi:tetratricopeptide (TPR) repeat protein
MNAPQHTPPGADRMITALIFGVTLLVRLLYLWQSADHPAFQVPLVDAESYDDIARQWARDRTVGPYFFWQPFFYPAFLSFVYHLTGSSIVWARIVQAVLGALTGALLFRLGRRVFSRGVGAAAAAIHALYGPLIFYELELVAAGWAAFWSVALILLIVNAEQRPAARSFFLLGLCSALSLLTRPEFFFFLAASLLWLLSRVRRRGQPITLRLAGLAAGVLLVLVPVSALNRKTTGHFTPLPFEGGNNIYLGWHPDPCRVLTIRPGPDWEEFVGLPARHGVRGHYEENRFFIRAAADLVVQHPAATLRNAGRKVLQLIGSREIPRNEDIYLYREWSGLLATLLWKVGRFGFPFGLLFPAAVAGLWWTRRQAPAPLTLFPLLYGLALLAVFVSGRYRVPMIPVLCLWAAAGGQALWRRWRAAGRGRRIRWIAGAVLLALLSSGPGPFCEEQVNYRAELYALLGTALQNRGRLEEAADAYFRSLEHEPDDPYTLNSLGSALVALHRPGEALLYLERAYAARSEFVPLLYNLGLAHRGVNQAEPARRYLAEAARLRPGHAGTWYSLGMVETELKQPAEAIAAFQRAVDLEPESFDYRFNLSLALYQNREYAAARAHLDRLDARSTGDFMVHALLADTLAKLGEPGPAVEQYRAALQRDPEWSDGLNNLAWLLLHQPEQAPASVEEARDLATRACALTSFQNANFMETLAVAQHRAGNTDEARVVARRALALARAAADTHLAQSIEDRLAAWGSPEDAPP